MCQQGCHRLSGGDPTVPTWHPNDFSDQLFAIHFNENRIGLSLAVMLACIVCSDLCSGLCIPVTVAVFYLLLVL